MATFTKSSVHTPGNERSVLISSVAAGDQIDVVAILGRPARRVNFFTTDAADIVSYRINNRRELPNSEAEYYSDAQRAFGKGKLSAAVVWSKAPAIYTSTGASFTTVEGLNVRSIEIDGLTLSTGVVIEIVVW